MSFLFLTSLFLTVFSSSNLYLEVDGTTTQWFIMFRVREGSCVTQSAQDPFYTSSISTIEVRSPDSADINWYVTVEDVNDYFKRSALTQMVEPIDIRMDHFNGTTSAIDTFLGLVTSFGAGCYQMFVDTKNPTVNPTLNTNQPSVEPSENPSNMPSIYPSLMPSMNPSIYPTMMPSLMPSINPSKFPTTNPSSSQNPTENPTMFPSSHEPSNDPSSFPSTMPSINPSIIPTKYPSINPTIIPTTIPSNTPTNIPTLTPLNSSSSNNSSSLSSSEFGIMIGSILSFMILTVIFILLFYFFKKKKKNKKAKKEIEKEIHNNSNNSNNDVFSDDINNKSSVTAGIYITPGDTVVTDNGSTKNTTNDEELYETKPKNEIELETGGKTIGNTPSEEILGEEDIELKPLKFWTNNDIITWLVRDLKYGQYVEIFKQNDINGQSIVHLDKNDLIDMGINKIGHIKIILQQIKNLHGEV